MASAVGSNAPPSTWMYKLSGDNLRWQKRYFVLKGTYVHYFKLEADAASAKKPRGSIDLTKACGVRNRSDCHDDIKWPNCARKEASFGVATVSRTWYIFAENTPLAKSWCNCLSKIVQEQGKPSNTPSRDIKGKPESTKSKMVRLMGQLVGKGAQQFAESGLIENDHVNTVISTAGTVAEEQAEMDPTETSGKDRFQTAAGTTVQGAGELTDNDVVGGVTDIAGEQIAADEDTSAGERITAVVGGSISQVGESGVIEGPGGEVIGKFGEGVSEYGGEMVEKMQKSSSSGSDSSDDDK